MKGLDILEYDGFGYKRLVNNGKWTFAGLNWAPHFDEKNMEYLERHNLTDEVFVLVHGKATLLIGDKCERVEMQPLKYYNVRAGIWHNIIVSKDARVLIAESSNTSRENTDYLSLITGEVFKKYPEFEEVLPETFLLKVPYGPIWTGVILVRGEKNIIVQSSHLETEKYLIPALAGLGMTLSDIDQVLNTRSQNLPPACMEGRFYALATPGHDNDCITWVDSETGTAFTGESLQANGIPTRGIGVYSDIATYRKTLNKLSEAGFQNIICSHDYDGIGCVVKGKDDVMTAIRYSEECIDLYDRKIKEYIATGVPEEAERLALKLIGEVGCGMPEDLSLAMNTVSEHLKSTLVRI